MRNRTLTMTLVALLAASVLTAPSIADEPTKQAAGKGGKQEMTADAAAAAEQAEMMAMMEKMGAPGPEHAMLAKMEGNWSCVVKNRWDPKGEWMESAGKASFRMILGGRYLEQTFHGEMMGSSFEGFGLEGFDKAKGKFFSTWCDSMSTSIMVSEGTWDEATKTTTMTGKMQGMAGEETIRMTSKMEGDDKHVFTMFSKAPDGSEFSCMEIIYNRM